MKTSQQSYPELAKMLGIAEIYLKREDLHTYGSHKGRSIPYMMKEYLKSGQTQFVISSSGNAALAVALFTYKHNQNNPDNRITLEIFVGEKITKEKLARLSSLLSDRIQIFQTERPKQQALQAKSEGKVYLRQSTDDLALVGYQELAEELLKIPNLAAVFIPTSSGTTAQALGEVFLQSSQKPQVHIVQTEACHPIASAMNNKQLTTNKKTSIASAIVDHVAFRKEKVADVVRQSNGNGWIVSDEEIQEVLSLVQETTGIDISPNSALSVAGLKEAIKNGWSWTGTIVCLITGA